MSYGTDKDQGHPIKLLPVSDRDIANRVSFPNGFPKIILAAGPNRVGSTAMARMFAEQEIPTWYQPLKAILRNRAHEQEANIAFPQGEGDVLFIKETLGPNSHNEASFNPLNVLLLAGVPPQNIHFVTVMRDPRTVAASIVDKFQHVVGKVEGLETSDNLIENFLASMKTLVQAQNLAKQSGIPQTSYVYEAYRDNKPRDVAEKLFHRLELEFHPERFDGWKKADALKDFLHQLDEPHLYHSDGLFNDVQGSNSIGYRNRDKTALPMEMVFEIDIEGASPFYAKEYRKASKQLRIAWNAEQAQLQDYLLMRGFAPERHVLGDASNSVARAALKELSEKSWLEKLKQQTDFQVNIIDPDFWHIFTEKKRDDDRWQDIVTIAERWATFMEVDMACSYRDMDESLVKDCADRIRSAFEAPLDDGQFETAALALDHAWKYGGTVFNSFCATAYPDASAQDMNRIKTECFDKNLADAFENLHQMQREHGITLHRQKNSFWEFFEEKAKNNEDLARICTIAARWGQLMQAEIIKREPLNAALILKTADEAAKTVPYTITGDLETAALALDYGWKHGGNICNDYVTQIYPHENPADMKRTQDNVRKVYASWYLHDIMMQYIRRDHSKECDRIIAEGEEMNNSLSIS